jgi:hypothetical protein
MNKRMVRDQARIGRLPDSRLIKPGYFDAKLAALNKHTDARIKRDNADRGRIASLEDAVRQLQTKVKALEGRRNP